MWGDGLCKLKNSEVGITGVIEVKVVRKSCVVMELLRSARPSSGRKADSWQREERELM